MRQLIQSPAWDRRIRLSVEAAMRDGGQEYWLPRRADVIELRPRSMPVSNVRRLSRPLRYVYDDPAEAHLGHRNGAVIFLCIGDGRWIPALLLHADPQPTVGQALRAAWRQARRSKREKERRLRRLTNGPM